MTLRIHSTKIFLLVTLAFFFVSKEGLTMTLEVIDEDKPSLTQTAPLSGRVKKVCVKQGDYVKEGDIVMILECMKMEMTITSSYTGIIKTCLVTEEDDVMYQMPLLTFSTDKDDAISQMALLASSTAALKQDGGDGGDGGDEGKKTKLLESQDALRSLFSGEENSLLASQDPTLPVVLEAEQDSIAQSSSVESDAHIVQEEQLMAVQPQDILTLPPLILSLPEETLEAKPSFDSVPRDVPEEPVIAQNFPLLFLEQEEDATQHVVEEEGLQGPTTLLLLEAEQASIAQAPFLEPDAHSVQEEQLMKPTPQEILALPPLIPFFPEEKMEDQPNLNPLPHDVPEEPVIAQNYPLPFLEQKEDIMQGAVVKRKVQASVTPSLKEKALPSSTPLMVSNFRMTVAYDDIPFFLSADLAEAEVEGLNGFIISPSDFGASPSVSSGLSQKSVKKTQASQAYDVSLHEVFIPPLLKTLLEDSQSFPAKPMRHVKTSSVSEEATDFFSLIKWLFGLFVLAISILFKKPRGSGKIIKIININQYEVVMHKKIAHNREDKPWPQKILARREGGIST